MLYFVYANLPLGQVPQKPIALILLWTPEILNMRKDISAYLKKTRFHSIIISDFSSYDLANLFSSVKWHNAIKWYQIEKKNNIFLP